MRSFGSARAGNDDGPGLNAVVMMVYITRYICLSIWTREVGCGNANQRGPF